MQTDSWTRWIGIGGRFHVQDVYAWMCILLVPILVHMPHLLGYFQADPAIKLGALAVNASGGYPGYAHIDPNGAFQTQALGHFAAESWMRGMVPWWNPYTGVGMPLAAEYQPAAFFPFIGLLLLPHGMVWLFTAMQVIAGWGTYALLRKLDLSRTASLCGGLLFAFNGTLAWFDHAPALPVAFLPWTLLGIEIAASRPSGRSGWRPFCLAVTLGILAGFPETTYLYGLFAMAWAALRFLQIENMQRRALALRLALGSVVALALSAPQWVAFAEFLPHAFLGGHSGIFAFGTLNRAAALPSLLMPYAYGPIFAFPWVSAEITRAWMDMGGYVTLALLVMAVFGGLSKKGGLKWLLVAWTVLALGKTFVPSVVFSFWNLIPGMTPVAFYRYATPTWELAIIVLAMFGLDAVVRGNVHARSRGFWIAAGSTVLLCTLGALGIASIWPQIVHTTIAKWMAASCALALATTILVLVLVSLRPSRLVATMLAALLAVEAAILFVIPGISNPRTGHYDTAAIRYLREHLGLDRFYSLGPIQANYSAYFGLASINYRYLPAPSRWTEWVARNLDRYQSNPAQFMGDGMRDPSKPDAASELRQHLEQYKWVGVRYVLANAGDDPFARSAIAGIHSGTKSVLPLAPGQSASGEIAPANVLASADIHTIMVFIGTYRGKSSGTLHLTACVAGTCSSGEADLAHALDNRMLSIPMQPALPVLRHQAIRFEFRHQGGAFPVALWSYKVKAAESQNLSGPNGPWSDHALRLKMPDTIFAGVRKVYADSVMNIFELAGTSPYFETVDGHCKLHVTDRRHLQADCDRPDTLVRRELYFPGWRVSVNGKEQVPGPYRALFQQLPLPAGRSWVVFHYAPRHAPAAWWALACGLLSLLVPWRRLRKHPRAGEDDPDPSPASRTR